MMVAGQIAGVFALVVLCWNAAGQLTGGVPPAPAQAAECNIQSLFSQLSAIRSLDACREGCPGGSAACPEDWYPGIEDDCSPECGRMYETFWDECGHMLVGMGMGGMDGMGAFYDECLEELYPPGLCGLFCNQHTYDCLLNEVQEACCDEGGANCEEGFDVPHTCPVGCALVWPEFTNLCHDHIEHDDAMELTDYQEFTTECLEADGMALVEYAMELKALGCRINLEGVEEGRRQLQGLLTQWIGSTSLHCVWEEIDELATEVDLVCCGADGGHCPEGPPDECSMGCMLTLHELTDQCGHQIEQILGSHRW